MLNRSLWLIAIIFWAVVYALIGWAGIGIILAFSATVIIIITLMEAKND